MTKVLRLTRTPTGTLIERVHDGVVVLTLTITGTAPKVWVDVMAKSIYTIEDRRQKAA